MNVFVMAEIANKTQYSTNRTNRTEQQSYETHTNIQHNVQLEHENKSKLISYHHMEFPTLIKYLQQSFYELRQL